MFRRVAGLRTETEESRCSDTAGSGYAVYHANGGGEFHIHSRTWGVQGSVIHLSRSPHPEKCFYSDTLSLCGKRSGRFERKGERVNMDRNEMGKRRKSRGMALLAVLLLFLCGCGKKGYRESQGDAAGMQAVGTYEAEFVNLEQYCESVSAVKLGSEKIFFAGTEQNEEALYSLEIGKEGVNKVFLETEAGGRVTFIGEDAEGNLLLAVTVYDGDPMADGKVGYVEIRKASSEGNILETVNTGNLFSGREAAAFYINGLYQDAEGNYYISSVEDVYVLNQDGSLFFQVSAGAYLSAMFVLGDGRVVVGYDGKHGWNLETVELSGKDLKPLESGMAFQKGIYRKGQETDLAYVQDAMLYICNLEDEEPAAVLNWRESNIDGNHIRDFAILPDGRVISLTVDYSAGAKKEIAILTEKKSGEMPEKKRLTYAALDVPYFVERDIVAFNKANSEYYIEVKEYGDSSMNYMDRVALLNADLTGSEAPDMMDVAFSGLTLENLIAAGVAEDLVPFLEKDASLGKEDFVESVLKAYERDGKLYAIIPSFGIETLVGKVSDVGEGSSWSVKDMMELAAAKGKDMQILEAADKGTMLWLMCMMNQDLFIDEENGTCDFTGREFAEILEFAGSFPEEAGNASDFASQMEKVRNGELVLLQGLVTSVELYQVYEYAFGESVNFIGYPTSGNSGQMLSICGTTVAMHAASENKQGVWEFIKFNLSEERQEDLEATSGSGFPVLKSALEKLFEEERKEEYYEDTDGEQKLRPKSSWGVNGVSIDTYAATEEQVERVRAMIDHVQIRRGMDNRLTEIIYGEAAAYFKGQKTVEEVAKVVQNRVQIYLDE